MIFFFLPWGKNKNEISEQNPIIYIEKCIGKLVQNW